MLNIHELSFSYGEKKILDRFSISVKAGEIVAVMGPSGCGKSTLLHLIAGLKKPTCGEITCNADRISYAFQEPRLFPWMTVEENLLAVLSSRDETARKQAEQALYTVSLSDAKALFPAELSGGMRTRASLARALTYGGDLFLLDEPFSALDAALRRSLAERLRNEFKARGATVILVTHDSEDASILADRTVRLS